MNLKTLIIPLAVIAAVLTVALNTEGIARRSTTWVEEHPDHPKTQTVLYWTARWCDWMGDDYTAIRLYLNIQERFPDQRALAAECLYRAAEAYSYSTTRTYAIPILEKLIQLYPDQKEWYDEGVKLRDLLKSAM